MPIYIVVSGGPIVLGAYSDPSPAHLHARCVTGASVVCVEVLHTLPDSIRDVLASEEFDDDTPTPVTELPHGKRKG